SASGRGVVRLNITRGDDGRRRSLDGNSRLDGLRRRRSRASERAERDRPAPEREDEGEREAQAEEEEFGPAVRDLRAREEDEVGHDGEDEEADDVDEDRLRGEGARDDAVDSLEREREAVARRREPEVRGDERQNDAEQQEPERRDERVLPLERRGRLRVRRERVGVRRFRGFRQVRLQLAEQVDDADGERDNGQAEQGDFKKVPQRAPRERAEARTGQREV